MIGDYLHRFGPVLRRFRDMLDGSHAEVVAVEGDVTIVNGGGSITVDGPLTDAQLRAAVVPVADGGGSLTVDGPLTDTQLSARLPLPVIGPQVSLVTLPVTLTLADTEYGVPIPACQSIEIVPRNGAAVRFAPETGKVATPTDPYRMINAGSAFYDNGNIAAFTLYLASSTPGVVVEVALKVIAA